MKQENNIVKTLKRLYKENPNFGKSYDDHYKSKHGAALNDLENNFPENLDLRSLDTFYKKEGESGFCLVSLIGGVSPEVIDNLLGRDLLFWTFIHYPYSNDERDSLEKYLDSSGGYNKDVLERARLSTWRLDWSRYGGESVQKLYTLIKETPTFLPTLAPDLLLEHVRPGVLLSEGRLGDYSIREANPYGGYEIGYDALTDRIKEVGNEEYIQGIYLDAPIGAILEYKGFPQAVVSFMNRGDALFIHQIQGNSQKIYREQTSPKYGLEPTGKVIRPRGLAPFNWKKLMYGIAERTARHYGFSRLGFLGGKNSRWIRPQSPNEEPHLTLEQAERVYDHTATYLGFERNSEDGNYYKNLQTRNLQVA